MSNYNNLRAEIRRAIKENGNQEITGDLLQGKLIEMIDSLGEGYSFKGIATPNGEPISTDANMFYIANEVGQYPYYGGLVVADGEIAILCYNGKWKKMAIGEIVTNTKLSETVSTINTTIRDATEELNNAIGDTKDTLQEEQQQTKEELNEAINDTKEELSKNIKNLATDLNDNYRTKEELENVLGFETLERVAGYSYVGMVNEETEKVVDIDGTSKVYYIVVAPIGYETLFSGLNSEAKGYTYVKSVEGQWVVEDLGIPFDLQGSLDGLNTNDASLNTKISQVENTANSKVAKQQSAGQGNVVMFGEGGEVADSNIEASNVAKQNGYYESMIVGASKNLAGSDVVTAKYTYRPTAGTADVADGVANISSVKGNTIVWNQISKINANSTFSQEKLSDTSFKLTPIGSVDNPGSTNYSSGRLYIAFPKLNHNIYIKLKYTRLSKRIDIEEFEPTNVILSDAIRNKHYKCSIGETININTIIKYNSEINYGIFLSLNDCIVQIDNLQCFDLTQMFGEGNEPTIEEFEAMFPNDYYEYNEEELRSIEDFNIKSVGFNQWDEEWETYDNGSWILMRNKYPIKVIPNETYYIESKYLKELKNTNNQYSIGSLYGIRKDNTETILTPTSSTLNTGYALYKIPEDVTHIRFVTCIAYGSTYRNDITINLSHSGIRDGEYESYQEDILPINISTIKDENGEQLFPNGLCSAGEAHDELVYDKGIEKWKAVKRIGSVDMGTLPWSYNAVFDYFSFNHEVGAIYQTSNANRGIAPNLLCSKYSSVRREFINEEENKDIKTITQNNGAKTVIIKDTSYTDATAFRESLQGQILYYELAEPIEVVLDDFTSNYKVSDWGTEEILMNSTPIVPVIYDVEYALNAVDTLRNMPTNYISKESLDAFLSALGTAMGGTWTATYNESNNRYDFTFSANTSTTELIEE